jgi:pyroglutamyl-peptidase
MPTRKVVVTGYEPWEHGTENPTLDILEKLRLVNFAEAALTTIKVPVDTTKITGIVERALEEHEPEVWISLGLAPGAPVVAIERLAANALDYPLKDNEGHQPHSQPVFPGGPMAYPATIPIKAVAAEIRRRGIPVKISNTASTYACNQIMYTSLHLIAEKGMGTRGGFIHVPCTPGYVAKQGYPFAEQPSMSLDLMVEATRAAIEVTLARDTDIEAPPIGY